MGDKNITVLVVDDESDFRQLLMFWLESKGYTVIGAPDGKTAISLVKEKNPDIVFMDLNMPVMDGSETIKNIREFNKELPIIIISAHVSDPRASAAIAQGISGVFYKGKDFEEGLSLLETALRMHKGLKKQE